MKRIAILGSTGSIGRNTLNIIERFPLDFRAVGLTANSNAHLLSMQIQKYRPLFVCINDKRASLAIKSKFDSKIKIFSGDDGLLRMLEDGRIDKVMLAVTGAAALLPLLKAIETGRDVALANKEALVMAGPIIMDRACKKNVLIIPVDSEQSAVWQCLQGQDKTKIKSIYLTASGGPFRALSKKEFKNISVKDAIRHPRWEMGAKISVDSASLMNKGLEILEAMYLFGVSADKIKIIIHPESIIHSMVEYIDGSVIAQLSVTDMRIPIQYALLYPQRLKNNLSGIDFFKLKRLNFEKPDFAKFPCLALAYKVAYEGGTAPAVLNAANEVSVNEFLKGKLSFTSIPIVIENVLGRRHKKLRPDLGDILEADTWARQEALRVIERTR